MTASAARPAKAKNDYPFGRWWIGAILFAIVWFLAYRFANIIFI